MNRRRLEAEGIRDAIMGVSGGLTFTTGGSILTYKDRQYVERHCEGGDIDYDNIRAVYIPVVRSSMYDVFQAFDLPDPSHVERGPGLDCCRSAGAVHDEQVRAAAAQPQDG